MKFITCATIFSVFFATLFLEEISSQAPVYYNGYGSNNITVGYPGPYDKKLFSQWFEKNGRWWNERSKIVNYPEHSSGTIRNETITAIRVINYSAGSSRNKTYAVIQKGGVGYRNVTIGLFSGSSGNGFRYLVEIWGRKY